MGNEVSTNERRNKRNDNPDRISQAQMQQLLNEQRNMYERRCQELADIAQAVTESVQIRESPSSSSRSPAPYSYTRDELHHAVSEPAPLPRTNLYPNLNTAGSSSNIHTFEFRNNQRPVQYPPRDFVFVNHNPFTPSAPPNPSRDRSSSRNRVQSRPAHGQRSEYDCPTCNCPFDLQIYQCSSGHSSCSQCKQFRRQCGVCRQDLTNMRNFVLEQMMAERKVPCVNSNEGCKLYIKLAEMEAHTNECPFKDIECPIKGLLGYNCRWKGKLSKLATHFDHAHPEQRQADVNSEMQLQNIIKNCHCVFLVLIGTYNFLFQVKVSETDHKVYFTAQLIGTKISAAKWYYEIHVYNKGQARRKYVYTDNCTSWMENVNDVFKEGRCAVMPLTYAMTYVNGGSLNFKVFIKKCNEEPKKPFVKNGRGRGRSAN